MAAHKEVPVKVNAFVDEGIAILVEALSDIPGLVTIESCQGGGGRDAYVFFRVGDWHQIGGLLFDRLLPSLPDRLREVTALQIEAYGASSAMGRITVEPAAVPALSKCVRALTAATVAPGIAVTGNAQGVAVTNGV